jgi:hypothetical protein
MLSRASANGFTGSNWVTPPRLAMTGIVVVMLLLTASCGSSIAAKQQALASELGVQIGDYAAPQIFPVGYFRETLKSGTEMNVVHQDIRGYDKVLHCETGGLREIYYYFSSDDQTAIRFQVDYGYDGKLLGVVSEDLNSRTIRTEGCVPGLLSPVS